MKILPIIVLIACVALPTWAQDDEARPAARGLLKRGPLVKSKTTTTTPPPQEEAEYEDEGDYPAEGEAQEAATEAPVTSTTEGKKLVAGGVRPFRSNTELLEILKRKRAQAAEAKLNGGSSSASQSQDSGSENAKSSYSGKSKKRFNNSPVTREVTNEEAPAPPPKPSRGRFAATRSVDPEEEQSDAAPPAKPSRTFRRGSN